MDKHRNENGTYNGVTALAELSGLSVDDIKAIAADVKTNHEKLRSCGYHEFERIPRPDDGVVAQARLGDRWSCTSCKGEIGAGEHYWHEQGRRGRPGQPGGVAYPSAREWAESVVGKPYEFTPVPGAVCSQVLWAEGKSAPKTCQVHGLLCGKTE